MYKNIIFDLGGVVVDFKPRDFLMDHFLNKSAEDEVFDLAAKNGKSWTAGSSAAALPTA